VDSGLDTTRRYFYTLIAHDENDPTRISGHAREVGRKGPSRALFEDLARDRLYNTVPENGNVAAFQKTMRLEPDQSEDLRVVRGVAPAGEDEGGALLDEARALLDYDMSQAVRANEQLYSSIPELASLTREERLTYWNAFSLMRQVMLPPGGQLSNNYYVFSREPTWGWGHGGQVFHESLTMLAYVFMDARSAQESQRVYMETQKENGYINYRTGGYLSEQIPTNDQLTSSAPWYNWQNWEVYKQSRDEGFLRDAYASGKKFYNWWLANRNQDDDALLEWGAHAVLECIRDGQVAVWDEVGWPAHFEGMDLNVMLVKEARALSKMAEALGDSPAARKWTREAETRTQVINDTFWDEETGFFYNVDRDDHDFTFEKNNDLKRQEIIGFLPLWAGTATQEQADRLVEHLTDESKFWRPHGVPSLAADDPYYDPNGYWNGPVWVEWQYLIFRGLLNYGYREEAETLAQRVIDKVAFHLKRDKTFWEMYGPDGDWAGHHQTYIWTGLVARMMLDLNDYDVGATDPVRAAPDRMTLSANFPDPFARKTTIMYQLAQARDVELSVYDTLGRRVTRLVDRPQEPGAHTVSWEPASDGLAGGVYFLRLRAGDRQATEEVIVAR
jgi:hypothetical protein